MKLQVTCVCAYLIFIGCAGAQNLNDWPKKEDSLHARVDAFDNLIRANHLNEGAVVPQVVLPPAGQPPITGNYEDSCAATGQYLAALAFKFAVTKDPQVRQQADAVWEGVLKSETVTGEPGAISRGFYKADAPAWHENAFFMPQEWRASTAMPGYRWLGEIGANDLASLMFGLYNYWDLCADDAHRKAVSELVNRVGTRCAENNFRIVDTDGKMTLSGNYSPDLPHEDMRALLLLSLLRTAVRMTDSQAFQTAHQRLLTKFHYDDQAVLAKRLDKGGNASDDTAAAFALYSLFRIEKEEPLLRKYRMSLNRFWFAWKESPDPFYAMIYQSITKEPVVTDAVGANIKALWAGGRSKNTWSSPSDAGVQQDQEEVPVALVLAYWFGRYEGSIDPAW
jgi:hypothetical protein